VLELPHLLQVAPVPGFVALALVFQNGCRVLQMSQNFAQMLQVLPIFIDIVCINLINLLWLS